jgi:hypothetical protein
LQNPILQNSLDILNEILPDAWSWEEKEPAGSDYDGVLTLKASSKKTAFIVKVLRELRGHQLLGLEKLKDQHPQNPLLVIADRISSNQKEWLKEKKINFLDGAGNVDIKENALVILIEGKKHLVKPDHFKGRAFTKSGLKVVFILLAFPDFLNKPYREIAALAGVSLDTVSKVIKSLYENGHLLDLNEKQKLFYDPVELLEQWIMQFGQRLQPDLLINRFKSSKNSPLSENYEMLEAPASLWGGEVAADILTNYLRPEEYIIYTENTLKSIILQYRLVPDPKGAFRIYRKFWKSPTDKPASLTVPPLLVYADLMLTGNARNIEVAKMIYDEYIQKTF